MSTVKAIFGYLSRHKIQSGLLAVIGAYGIACANFVIGGTIEYGVDHVKPRLHQFYYQATNWYKTQGADVVILYSCDWATSGNIVSLYNQLNYEDNSRRNERGMQVISVVYDGNEHVIPKEVSSVSFKTSLGAVVFFKSGFYTYISQQSAVAAEHDEKFLVSLLGKNSESEIASLSIDAFSVTQTANLMADYGNQISGPNYELNGQKGYQTPNAAGSMLFGFNDEDFLVGSGSSDAIFGWTKNDHIRGLAGNDVLMGEHGENLLSGGDDGDVFWISGTTVNSKLVDRILDFSMDDGDVLVLSDVVSNYHGSQPLNFVRLKASASELVVLVNTDGVGDDFFPVARLDANPGFDPRVQSVADLVERGFFQL